MQTLNMFDQETLTPPESSPFEFNISDRVDDMFLKLVQLMAFQNNCQFVQLHSSCVKPE